MCHNSMFVHRVSNGTVYPRPFLMASLQSILFSPLCNFIICIEMNDYCKRVLLLVSKSYFIYIKFLKLNLWVKKGGGRGGEFFFCDDGQWKFFFCHPLGQILSFHFGFPSKRNISFRKNNHPLVLRKEIKGCCPPSVWFSRGEGLKRCPPSDFRHALFWLSKRYMISSAVIKNFSFLGR